VCVRACARVCQLVCLSVCLSVFLSALRKAGITDTLLAVPSSCHFLREGRSEEQDRGVFTGVYAI
jgi:hypothetical protein